MVTKFAIRLAGMFLVSSAAAQTSAPFDYAAFLKGVSAPADFTIELAAGEPAIRFPMFVCFDDAERLYVAESSGKDLYAGLRDLTKDCRVSRLEDADGDGRFEKATVFAEGITFPMVLAWRAGRLYLADPPELVALTDTAGSLTAQSPDATALRDATGAHRIRAADIATLERVQLSTMPAGLEQLLTRHQLRDLLAYLQSLK
jgi:glucose/arabinose dehydrogenase